LVETAAGTEGVEKVVARAELVATVVAMEVTAATVAVTTAEYWVEVEKVGMVVAEMGMEANQAALQNTLR
jgi:hypothetical protein